MNTLLRTLLCAALLLAPAGVSAFNPPLPDPSGIINLPVGPALPPGVKVPKIPDIPDLPMPGLPQGLDLVGRVLGAVPEDCVPSSTAETTPWVEVPGVGAQSTTRFSAVACDAGNLDPLAGTAESTASFEGECTVTVSKTLHEEGWAVNLLIFQMGTHTVVLNISSHLQCSGTVTVTVTYSGGLGPRVGSSTAGTAEFAGPNGMTAPVSLPVRQNAGGCAYMSPVEESCTETKPLSGHHDATFANLVPKSVNACVEVAWTNGLQDVSGIASASGNLKPCTRSIPVQEINAERLSSLLG